MIDTEVLRLRNLRIAALRARTLARVLDTDSTSHNSVLAMSAVKLWTVVRIITGQLRAHPYLPYQQDASPIRLLLDNADAALKGFTARRQLRPFSVFAQQLQLVARELDDVRALTRSQPLSDALGRSQAQLRRLLQELALASRAEKGAQGSSRIEANIRPEVTTRALGEVALASDWPYLAI
jgi:hypothetical protein